MCSWAKFGFARASRTCSGRWPRSKDADLELATAKYPNIRLISVPNFGTQEPQKDFRGAWRACQPETVAGFSAVGYFFGRQLHQALGVPVGLINDAWGGSACEAWIRRDVLAADPKFALMLKRWEQIEKDYPRTKAEYDSKMAEWKLAAEKARSEGKRPPRQPQNPDGMMSWELSSRQHLQRRAQAHDRLRHPGRHLVSGRVERRESLPVSRLVPADDQELARRMGPG